MGFADIINLVVLFVYYELVCVVIIKNNFAIDKRREQLISRCVDSTLHLNL